MDTSHGQVTKPVVRPGGRGGGRPWHAKLSPTVHECADAEPAPCACFPYSGEAAVDGKAVTRTDDTKSIESVVGAHAEKT